MNARVTAEGVLEKFLSFLSTSAVTEVSTDTVFLFQH